MAMGTTLCIAFLGGWTSNGQHGCRVVEPFATANGHNLHMIYLFRSSYLLIMVIFGAIDYHRVNQNEIVMGSTLLAPYLINPGRSARNGAILIYFGVHQGGLYP